MGRSHRFTCPATYLISTSCSPPKAGCDLSSLGAVVVAFVPHPFFLEISLASPRIRRALSLLTLADAAALRNWIINFGSRDSLTRVAHLICEIIFRLRAVGQAREYQLPAPFTQSDLAAACGISTVHANRLIQELRRKHLLQWQSRTITITDWPGLAHAGFRPDFLYLREAPPLGALQQPGALPSGDPASQSPA